MVLLHKVVEILTLPDPDRRLVDLIVVGNRCRVAATLINRNLLWEPVRTNRLVQEGRGSSAIAVRGQQKINGLSVFVAA
jgi:hypothetical protein